MTNIVNKNLLTANRRWFPRRYRRPRNGILSAGQEIIHHLWKPQVNDRVYNSPPLDPIHSQMNPVANIHTLFLSDSLSSQKHRSFQSGIQTAILHVGLQYFIQMLLLHPLIHPTSALTANSWRLSNKIYVLLSRLSLLRFPLNSLLIAPSNNNYLLLVCVLQPMHNNGTIWESRFSRLYYDGYYIPVDNTV
jgi:hypothetical protein